jgi:hypothetical protein
MAAKPGDSLRPAVPFIGGLASPQAPLLGAELVGGDMCALADELGGLERDYAVAEASWSGRLARMEQLRDALRRACPAKASEEWQVAGQRFGVVLSPRALKRSVNKPALLKRIGLKGFARIASVTLGDVERLVDPEVAAEVIVREEHAGTRRITIFEKGSTSNPERALS